MRSFLTSFGISILIIILFYVFMRVYINKDNIANYTSKKSMELVDSFKKAIGQDSLSLARKEQTQRINDIYDSLESSIGNLEEWAKNPISVKELNQIEKEAELIKGMLAEKQKNFVLGGKAEQIQHLQSRVKKLIRDIQQRRFAKEEAEKREEKLRLLAERRCAMQDSIAAAYYKFVQDSIDKQTVSNLKTKKITKNSQSDKEKDNKLIASKSNNTKNTKSSASKYTVKKSKKGIKKRRGSSVDKKQKDENEGKGIIEWLENARKEMREKWREEERQELAEWKTFSYHLQKQMSKDLQCDNYMLNCIIKSIANNYENRSWSIHAYQEPHGRKQHFLVHNSTNIEVSWFEFED